MGGRESTWRCSESRNAQSRPRVKLKGCLPCDLEDQVLGSLFRGLPRGDPRCLCRGHTLAPAEGEPLLRVWSCPTAVKQEGVAAG